MKHTHPYCHPTYLFHIMEGLQCAKCMAVEIYPKYEPRHVPGLPGHPGRRLDEVRDLRASEPRGAESADGVVGLAGG